MAASGLHYRFPPRYRVIWGAVALLLAAILITAPDALNASSMRIETPLVAILAIAALGQLLVVMMGGFDLSVAAVVSLAAVLLLDHTQGANDKAVVGVLLALGAAMAAGAVNGVLAGPTGLNPLVVTLAMGGVVSAIALLITNDGVSVLSAEIPPGLTDFATSTVGNVSALLFVAVGLVALVAAVLRGTTLGRRFLAAGTNPTAARIVGVPVARYQIASYAIAGLMYGIAGVLLASFVGQPNLTVGDPYLLATFIVVALGGALFAGGPTSVLSTFGGAIFLTWLIHYLAIQGLSAGARSLIQGIVLVLAVAIVTALSGRTKQGGASRFAVLSRITRPRGHTS